MANEYRVKELEAENSRLRHMLRELDAKEMDLAIELGDLEREFEDAKKRVIELETINLKQKEIMDILDRALNEADERVAELEGMCGQ